MTDNNDDKGHRSSDGKEMVYLTKAELQRLKESEVVEITREEMESLKKAAGPNLKYGDMWPGSASPKKKQ